MEKIEIIQSSDIFIVRLTDGFGQRFISRVSSSPASTEEQASVQSHFMFSSGSETPLESLLTRLARENEEKDALPDADIGVRDSKLTKISSLKLNRVPRLEMRPNVFIQLNRIKIFFKISVSSRS